MTMKKYFFSSKGDHVENFLSELLDDKHFINPLKFVAFKNFYEEDD